jgi:hypothetical protein
VDRRRGSRRAFRCVQSIVCGLGTGQEQEVGRVVLVAGKSSIRKEGFQATDSVLYHRGMHEVGDWVEANLGS